MGQGGYFGDYEGHSEIGRRGGQMCHERAMRAPRDEEGRSEDVGQGGYFGDYEGHSSRSVAEAGQMRHERERARLRDEEGRSEDVGQGGELLRRLRRSLGDRSPQRPGPPTRNARAARRGGPRR